MYEKIWSVLGVMKIIFIVFDVIFLAGFIYSLRRGLKFRPHFKHKRKKKTVPTVKRQVVLEQWMGVTRKMETGTPDSMKVAIIDADKLVDGILKIAGIKGEHMADRLAAIATDNYVSYNRLWEAHRLRNQLVHSTDFTISKTQAQNAISSYEAFLKEIGVLE